MRIFLDANILFSAAKSEGAIHKLVSLLQSGDHQCCVDEYVVEEARRNLAAKAPERTKAFNQLLSSLHADRGLRIDRELESSLPVAAKDRPVLAAAIQFDCAALLTGDRTHFGSLYGRKIHGVAIHSPRSIAEALL